MIKVTYINPKGRKFLHQVENTDSEEMYQYGIPIGPPDIVDELGLPEEIATRLHNQLFQRELWSMKEIDKNPRAVFAALQATFGINQQMIVNAYMNYEKEPE